MSEIEPHSHMDRTESYHCICPDTDDTETPELPMPPTLCSKQTNTLSSCTQQLGRTSRNSLLFSGWCRFIMCCIHTVINIPGEALQRAWNVQPWGERSTISVDFNKDEQRPAGRSRQVIVLTFPNPTTRLGHSSTVKVCGGQVLWRRTQANLMLVFITNIPR